MTVPVRVLCTVALGLAASTLAPRVDAQSVDACAAAYEHAQELRRDAKLVEARDELLVCASASCPAVTTPDCARWLREVDAATPTIVILARDGAGHDVFDAHAVVDGREVAARLDGKPVSVDPGEHVVQCERSDGKVAVVRILVREGEKNRLVTALYPAPAPAAVPPPRKRVPWTAYAVGAGGVVALGAGITLDVIASNDVSTLRASCAPFCSESALNRARTRMIVGDVLAGVGVLALGAGAWLWLHPVEVPSAPRAGLVVGPFTGLYGAF